MPRTHQITETSPLLHDANCVYCHVDLELGDEAVVCDSCDSPHHLDCWQANNDHCATFGCGEAADFMLTLDTVDAEPNVRPLRTQDFRVDRSEMYISLTIATVIVIAGVFIIIGFLVEYAKLLIW